MNRLMPLVSCIIPSYKRSDTIKRAIDSVLDQTYKNIEVLIVDDNEPDDIYSHDLKKLVSRYNEENVKLLFQPRHINGAAARNYGVKKAQGEYIAFLDDDDEWFPTKIEKQIRFLLDNNDYNAVSTLSSVYSHNILRYSQKPYSTDNLQYKVLLRKVGIATPTFLARKKAFTEMGGFDESLIRHQDLQLFVAFLDTNKIGLIPEVLVKIHSDSEINRPDLEKLIRIKKDYFRSISPYLKKYSKKELKRVYCNHNFEVAYIALKKHKYITFFKYMVKSGLSLHAIKDLWERIGRR